MLDNNFKATIKFIDYIIKRYINLDFTKEELEDIVFDEYEKCYRTKGKQCFKLFRENIRKRLDNIIITKIREDNNDYLLNQFLKLNEPFVEFFIKNSYSGILKFFDRDEALNLGLIGMYKALKTFDVNKGYSFTCWAGPKIRGVFTREIRENGYTIRKSAEVLEKSDKINKAIQRIKAMGEEVTLDLISQITGLKPSSIDKCIKIMNDTGTISLSTKVKTNSRSGEQLELGDVLVTNINAFDNIIEKRDVRHILDTIMDKSLNAKQKMYMKALYFSVYGKDMNKEMLARFLDVTSSAIWQQEKTALKRMRNHPLAKSLEDYRDDVLVRR